MLRMVERLAGLELVTINRASVEGHVTIRSSESE